MKKFPSQYMTIAAILISGVAIAGALFITGNNKNIGSVNPVRIENGKEVIHMVAKTGYTPNSATIHAGKEAILEVETNGTFDCSSGINIPSLGIQKYLPTTGKTDITIPPQKAGTQINGTCSMGMYRFTINVI